MLLEILQGSKWDSFARQISPVTAVLIGLVSLAPILQYLVARYHSTSRRTKILAANAPQAPHWAPLGIDLFVTAISRLIRHDFFAWTRQILDVPGRTVSLSMCGISLMITDDPDNIKAVLSTKFKDFGKGETFHKIWYDLMFDSVFATDGKLWHSNVDLLRNHTAKIRPTDSAILEKHLKILIKNLSDEKPHECFDQIDRFNLDVVTDIFYGESTGSLLKEKQPLRDAVEDLYVWNTRKTLIGELGALLPGNSRASAVIETYLGQTIDRATSIPVTDPEKSRRDQTLLGSLIRQDVSRKRIKDQMMAILIGGKDPTAITVVWALYELARKPKIVEDLREQIGSTIGFSRLPTPAECKAIPLLQNIIKETLRLHSPLGFNIRTALSTTSLPTGGGIDGKGVIEIPKGTHVILSYMGLQRRHDLVGPTADEFDPHRWETWTPRTWEFIPFNHGPRICLGKAFAWMQLEYIICRLMQVFERLDLVDSHGYRVQDTAAEMKTKIALNSKAAGPVLVRFMRDLHR